MAALLRWLVRLYPPALRRTHGQEIAAAIRTEWDRSPNVGVRLRLAAAFLADVAHCWGRAIGDVRPAVLTRGWMSDVRHSLRVLRRTPGHIAATVLSLGVGVAASSSVFSLVNGLLYRDLPGVHDRSGLLRIRFAPERESGLPLAPATNDVRLFERGRYQTIAGLASEGEINVAAIVDGEPSTGTAAFVSGQYFTVLGTRPQLGRLLAPSDDRPSAPPVVVVSDLFWRRMLAGRRDAIGRPIAIAGRPHIVVGVAPVGFGGVELSEFGAPAGSRLQLWLPLAAATGWPGAPKPETSWHAVFVRLANGAMAEAPAAELTGTAAGTTRDAAPDGPARVVTAPLSAGPGDVPADVAIMIALFLAVPLFVLAIGCANVANLQLARATDRAREVAVRMSLGASRLGAVRLLATETLVLASLTGLVAITATSVALDLLATFVPLPLGIDWRVLTFSLGLIASIILAAGVAPAWLATRQSVALACREVSPTGGPHHTRVRRALVVLQAALSLVLLAMAALFGRSLQNIHGATPPATRELVVGRVDLGTAGYDGPGARRFLESLSERLSSDPAIRTVGAQSLRAVQYRLVGGDPASPSPAIVRYVTPTWFHAMGVQALSGRVLREEDGPMLAVVNERLSVGGRQERRGVGDVLELRGADGQSPHLVSIVGVIPNERRPPDPHDDRAIYLLMPDAPPTSLTFIVRTRNPGAAVPIVRQAATDVDDRVAFSDLMTGEALLARDVSPVRYVAMTVGALGAIALVLSATGLYAVMSYVVALRRHEIGIRLAVGARPSDVVRLVLRESTMLALSGVVVGLVLALPATYAVRFLFVGVSVLDPAALGGPAVVLIGSAIAAAALPARRAARVDPVQTLRENA